MKKVLVVLGAVVAIAMLIVALRTETTSSTVPQAHAEEVATTAAAPPPPVVTAPVAAPSVVATGGASATTPAPLANDPNARREEIEAIAARGDVSALPELMKTDLTADGYVAAAAIIAVGKLAAIAPEKEKREAVAQLGKWLRDESKRKALGNVSITVDALQDSKSDAAIAPLVAALDAGQPLHIETRIVEALTSLDATSAAPSVERWMGRVKAMHPQDDFEKELAAEALVAGGAALKKWRP